MCTIFARRRADSCHHHCNKTQHACQSHRSHPHWHYSLPYARLIPHKSPWPKPKCHSCIFSWCKITRRHSKRSTLGCNLATVARACLALITCVLFIIRPHFWRHRYFCHKLPYRHFPVHAVKIPVKLILVRITVVPRHITLCISQYICAQSMCLRMLVPYSYNLVAVTLVSTIGHFGSCFIRHGLHS